MADDINEALGEIEEPNEAEEKKFTKADVARIVKARIDRMRKLDAEKAVQEEQPLPGGDNPMAPAPTQAQPGSSAELPGGNGGTQQSEIEQAIKQQFDQQNQHQEEQQFSQMYNNHQNNVQKMLNEDEGFKDLVDKANEQKIAIPTEVGVHLSNNLTSSQSKKVFKELLSNENSFLKMQNSYLVGQQTGTWDKYNNWLKQILNTSTDSEVAPEPVPDLGRGEATADSAGDMGNVDSYMKSL